MNDEHELSSSALGAWILFFTLHILCLPFLVAAHITGSCFNFYYKCRRHCYSILASLRYDYHLRCQRLSLAPTARGRRSKRRNKIQTWSDAALTLP